MSRVLPILFNTDMVRAILDKRKTTTRRALKHPFEIHPNGYITKPKGNERLCPYESPYQPGDILYVRETWQYLYELDENEQIIEGTGRYYYAASDTLPFDTYIDSRGATRQNIPWRPSIHMPKEAARIWLKVTDVRVERLQEMWASDVLKEGLQFSKPHTADEMLMEFAKLWNSTIKKSDLDRYGWGADPWVWVINFERCEKPESEEKE